MAQFDRILVLPLYVAGLIHRDSRSVIKVVRYGLNIACFPNEHAVEQQIARQRERREEHSSQTE
jgi:hypothetical protein